MGTKESLSSLRKQVSEGRIERTRQLWGGAGAIVTGRQPERDDPSAVVVVTEHARELSWLFEQFRDMADYLSKYELYPRLAEAANAAIGGNPGISAQKLCLAVLDEAERMCAGDD